MRAVESKGILSFFFFIFHVSESKLDMYNMLNRREIDTRFLCT